jgi:ribonuclease HI
MTTVKVTDELIRSGMSTAGGWTKEQLGILGVSWPPESGWRKRVIGTEITSEQAERFANPKRKPKKAKSAFKLATPSDILHPGIALQIHVPVDPSVVDALVQFDGSCQANGSKDATGKWGYRLQVKGEPDTVGSGDTCAELVTNNVSEWQGLRAGLQAVQARVTANPQSIGLVLIQGDSMLVIRCLTGSWKSKNAALTVYRDECRELLAAIGRPWHAVWIPREQNEYCDSLTRPDYDRTTSANCVQSSRYERTP